jgi:hypothetical protein
MLYERFDEVCYCLREEGYSIVINGIYNPPRDKHNLEIDKNCLSIFTWMYLLPVFQGSL